MSEACEPVSLGNFLDYHLRAGEAEVAALAFCPWPLVGVDQAQARMSQAVSCAAAFVIWRRAAFDILAVP